MSANTATNTAATTTGTPAPTSALSASRTTATAARVLRQLRHDPRTIALLILIPCVMLVLLRYVFDGSPRTFDSIGASLLGIFPSSRCSWSRPSPPCANAPPAPSNAFSPCPWARAT